MIGQPGYTKVIFERPSLWPEPRSEAKGEMANIPRVGELVTLADDDHATEWRVAKVTWKLESSGATAYILLELP